MTLTEARNKLKPPLIFGKTDQIQAADFIGRVQECLDAMNHCPHKNDCKGCGGTGEVTCEECEGTGVCCECERDCLECVGIGSIECEECDGGANGGYCNCLDHFTEDEKIAARTAKTTP